MLAHFKRCIYLFMLKIMGKDTTNYKIMKDLFSPFFKYKNEYKEEIDFLKKRNYITMFPYPFIDNYKVDDISVFKDEELGMHYVMHYGKRLYYPSDMTEDMVKATYRAVLLEQDADSPHKYFSQGYEFEEGGIFVDVGCAEANMALEVVELSSKVLLFEAEEKWMDALRATFAPYADKVKIINKYASNSIAESQTTLDSELLVTDEQLPFVYIKIDAEGAEEAILEGARETMRNNRVVCACCTYHKKEDAEHFANIFQKMGYQFEYSKGVAIFKASKKLEYPYFRKCLLRAKNFYK